MSGRDCLRAGVGCLRVVGGQARAVRAQAPLLWLSRSKRRRWQIGQISEEMVQLLTRLQACHEKVVMIDDITESIYNMAVSCAHLCPHKYV